MTNDLLQEIEELHNKLIKTRGLVESLESEIRYKISTLDDHPLVNIIRQEENKKVKEELELLESKKQHYRRLTADHEWVKI